MVTTEAIPAVSRATLATLLGISGRQAARLESAQVLTPTRRPAPGRASRYDVGANVRAYLACKLRESPRDRRDAAQAELLQLRIARERGHLISRQQAVMEGRAICGAIAAQLRALPARLVRASVIPRDGEDEVRQAVEEMQLEMSRWRTLEDLRAATIEPDPHTPKLPRRQPGRKELIVDEPEEHRH